MPKYDARCKTCGAQVEYVKPIAECMDTPECCSAPMDKVILVAPKGYVAGKFDAFKSPVDGSVITGKRALEEHNKRNNVVSMADGYSEDRIRAGNFGGEKPNPEKVAKELKQDMSEAYAMVKDGYKPKIEVQNED